MFGNNQKSYFNIAFFLKGELRDFSMTVELFTNSDSAISSNWGSLLELVTTRIDIYQI